jgi:uncharacterized protein YbjQ (UPF0145 family)
MRIGVNISDDLRERMKPLMLVSNISQICRDAIKAYVENYERAKERAKSDGMEVVAERLAKEISPGLIDWGTLGLEDAKLWVQLAKPEDFEHQLCRLERFNNHKESPWTLLIEPVAGSTWNFHIRADEHKEWLRWIDQSDDGTSSLYLAAKTEYEQGYLNYIVAVWQMVKERVAANTATMEKKFKEAREKSLEDGLKDGKAKAEILAKQ